MEAEKISKIEYSISNYLIIHVRIFWIASSFLLATRIQSPSFGASLNPWQAFEAHVLQRVSASSVRSPRLAWKQHNELIMWSFFETGKGLVHEQLEPGVLS